MISKITKNSNVGEHLEKCINVLLHGHDKFQSDFFKNVLPLCMPIYSLKDCAEGGVETCRQRK